MDEEKYLDELVNKLINTKKVNFKDRINAPETPGCYIAWQDDKIIYVGETNNLNRRMKLMAHTGSHTLRNNIGQEIFSMGGGQNKKFSPDIEEKLDNYFKENISLSIMSVKLGRTELEERIIQKHCPKYNKSKRGN